jgi:hypothetical protein
MLCSEKHGVHRTLDFYIRWKLVLIVNENVSNV